MYSKIILFFIATLCTYAQNSECNLTNCMLQGGQLGWDQNLKQWSCHGLIEKYNDETYNATNKDKCEKKSHLYQWDGYAFQCLSSKKFVPIRPLPDKIDVAQRQLECDKQKGAFGFNDNKSNFECYKIAYKDPEALGKGFERYQEKLCESKGYKYIGELSNDEWTCVIKNTSAKSKTKAQQHDELYQRKRACEYIDKTLKWNKNNQKWECLDSVKTVSILPDQTIKQPINVPSVSNIVQGEPQERRAMCEQRGFYFLWDSSINNWQCFKHVDKLEDVEKNSSYINNCVTLGLSYMELEKNKWGCVDSVLKLEEKPLNISLLKPKCDKQNGELIWKDHRWTCAIKSTREEIEKAQTPPLKSPTPLIQEKAILQLNNQKTEEILNFDFSDDGKYLTTYSVNSSHYVARAFKLATMESLSSLTFSKSKHSRLHKNMLFVFGSDNDDFEIINLVNNKSLLALPNSKVRSIAITNNDKFLVLSSYKNLSIYDTKNWKLHCSIPVRHVDLGYRNILDISKPLFYENIDGQKAALDIATGQNITPLPSLPPRFGYEIKTPSPDSLPIELNATKNKLYYSGDFHYAIEAGRESFNIWDLEKKVILSTKKGALIDYLGSIKTTKDYAIFHAVIGTRSTYLLDFNNPSVLKQLTYSTERPLYYKQQKNSNILETGGKIGWDFNSAGTILTKPFPFHQDLMGQIRYFSNGKHAAIVGGGNQVLYYDLLNNKELAKFGGGKWTHETTSTQIELSPDESKIVATANHERDIIVWDVNQSKIDYTIPNSAKWGNPFVITPDSQNIISLSYSPSDGEAKGLGYHPYQGTLNVWNFKTGVLERSLPKRATTFALIPNTHLLALGENDGTISIWDYRNGLERFRLNGHEHKIESLTLIHHGHTLLSRDAHSKMIRWEYIQNDPKGTKMLHGIPYRTELSHNENYMLITQEDYKKEGKIRLLNLKTSQYEYEFPFPTSYAMRKTFSNDDKYFFLSTPENATKVFQTATGKELATLQAYDNGEWIIMTPQGYFNASSKGREFIIDASGNTIDDATYKKYFNPEKVKDILNPREPR